MKFLVIGGGPGGLYASLLLKKADPAHEIHIYERNPEGATYGWGVVFSSLTLTSFREADITSYTDITDQFVIWNPIDIHYKGQLVRCDGHTFAGMSRRKLLNVLADRCLELGVQITYEHELSDFSIFDDYDVIIAADGINSFVRNAYADHFQPRLTPGKARFVWYGTHKVFDSFTFVILETEHGVMQVHAYPFDGNTSTFIVEMDEATWQKAGFDGLDEAQNLAKCEALFAEYLDGYGLMSNKSEWIQWREVKVRKWSYKNIVLLGDSAHTAHFSIGSGTRLAMEDAIALANAFEIHGADVKAAFNAYELERKPRTEMLQAAALQSQQYFEDLRRYIHLEPMQFSFHLLTRSGRLNYDNLRLRDPYYVEKVDRWFFRGDSRPVLVAAPPAFTPLTLRDVTLTNRVVLTPSPCYTSRDGLPDAEFASRLGRLASGGAGLVLTEPVAVSAEGRITPGCPGLYGASHQKSWKALVDEVHSSEAKIALQLNHAGRRGSTKARQFGLDVPLKEGNWPLLSVSDVPYSPRSQTPKAMDRADMDAVKAQFVQSAKMPADIGFDMLLLNMAQGYLLGSFISPLSNNGSLEDRLRFPLEIFEAVRAVWGRPLAVAINGSDWAKGGITREDVEAMARIFTEKGCDLIYPLAGQTVPNDDPDFGPNYLAEYSELIRNAAGVPTLTGGNITTMNQVNSLLAAGSADLCVLMHD